MTTVSRRGFCGLFTVAILAAATNAFAGSYLNRAALLVEQARREADILRRNLNDPEMARVVRTLCQGRVAAGQEMLVPKEVKLAHPHLVLMLERYERAADAAVRGKAAGFLAAQREAQDEEQIYRSILKRLGWQLPDL